METIGVIIGVLFAIHIAMGIVSSFRARSVEQEQMNLNRRILTERIQQIQKETQRIEQKQLRAWGGFRKFVVRKKVPEGIDRKMLSHCLLVEQGTGAEHRIVAVQMVVGRMPQSGKECIVIPVNTVSRNHATIHYENNRIFIEDNGSANGTFIDEVPTVGKTELLNGSTVRFGKKVDGTTFRLIKPQNSSIVCPINNQVSLYLSPHDGKPLPPFRPGQYLTFKFPIGNESVVRCYSLSDCSRDGDSYRITVKRVLGGLASNYIHDELCIGDLVDVQAPAGDFVFNDESKIGNVFIAGGIGITPLLSMLNEFVKEKRKEPVWLFYSVRNQFEYIFKDHLNDIAQMYPNVYIYICQTSKRYRPFLDSDVDVPNFIRKIKSSDDPLSKKLLHTLQDCARESILNHAFVAALNEVVYSDLLLDDLRSLPKEVRRMLSRPWDGEADAKAHLNRIIIEHCYHKEIKPSRFHYPGRLDIHLLKKLLPCNNYNFYICGPGGMTKDVCKNLKAWGVPKGSIHYELFGPASVGGSGDDTVVMKKAEITFRKSRKVVSWTSADGSILDVAMKNKIPIPSGCRVGNCSTCKTAILSGAITYGNQEPSAPTEFGTCYTCLATPEGDVVLDA